MRTYSQQLNIYHFGDYRKYLFAYYSLRKQSRTKFSYRHFATDAGFSSPNFLKLVIDGKKNLTKQSATQVSAALELSHEEEEYFLLLVAWNQNKKPGKKVDLLKDIAQFHTQPKFVPIEDYDYFKKWQYPILRELVSLTDFQLDTEWIQNKLSFSMSKKEIEEAFAFLEKHQFLGS